MKIESTLQATPSLPTRHMPPRSAMPGFRLPEEEAARAPSATAGAARIQASALIAAIAANDERGQRRQRRQGHAAALLDRLEALTRDLLTGRVESDALDTLGRAIGSGGEMSDDPALEELVAAVELRAAVEMAKLRARKGRL